MGDGANMPLITAVCMMKSRLLDLIRVMPVATAVIRIDTDTIVSVNEAWTRMIGPLDVSACTVGKSPIWVDSNAWGALLERLHQARERLLNKIEVSLLKADGTQILCELSLVLHKDVVPVMAILTIDDISLRRKAEETMAFLAYRDMLTELPNRTSLKAALECAYEAWDARKAPFAVIMLDLDGFKPINDTYGHDAGDEVLRAIGARLMNANRSRDVVARIGGDEFAVILNDCADREAAGHVAQRLIDAIAHPISLKDPRVSVAVGASAGVAHVSEGGNSAEAVLTRADRALYDAKTAGKNCVRFAPPE